MARAVIFETPGLIDKRAFTVVGLHAKPNTNNPLGYFGTGLKIAISVLLRNGIKVTIFIGQEEYVFYTKKGTFRGAEYDQIRMKRRRGFLSSWTYEELPYTTQWGKNWELWQAFRELETNTRDEGGKTYLINGPEWLDAKEKVLVQIPDSDGVKDFIEFDRTRIMVEGERFVDEFLDMNRTFLEGGLSVRADKEELQVLEKPSKHVYFRGMRVMDLKQEAQFTYNVLRQIDLTEDRTAKYPWEVEGLIAKHWIEAPDEKQVRKAVMAPRSSFEGSLSFGSARFVGGGAVYGFSTPFYSLAKESPNPSAKELWDESQPSVPTKIGLLVTIPKSEVTSEELEAFGNAVTHNWPGATIENTHTHEWWPSGE